MEYIQNIYEEETMVEEFGYGYLSPISKRYEYRSTRSLKELQYNLVLLAQNRPDIDQDSLCFFVRQYTVSRWRAVDTLAELA